MDVVIITYNSAKWIKKCLDSISNSNGVEKTLNLFVVDNHSTDQTRNLLDSYDRKEAFASFSISGQDKNLGFGKANNIGAGMGKDQVICFINVDTEVLPETFGMLYEEIENSDHTIGGWEMRQLPYEHPKLYNPVSGETTWVSGAAFAVRREVYQQVGGFDNRIFMYGEDVDLSWRIRAADYQLKYCPKVLIYHYAYRQEKEVKPVQYLEAIKNNLLLRYRYGTVFDIFKGHLMFWEVFFLYKHVFKGAKKELLKKYGQHWKDVPYFWRSRIRKKGIAKFLGWDYEIVREGAFFKIKFPKKNKKVSVVVRTCQRPDVLRETLISLENQTYRDFEVIVVEDGLNTAEMMIKEEFSSLDIKYFFTGQRQGRSIAGNIGLAESSGDYVNFLDDDDVFFADHLELMVSALETTDMLAAYSFGFETPIKVYSKEPYKYKVKQYNSRYKEEFNKGKLCHHNYIPIQCIMFSRILYEQLGGFDTSLDYLEDWDLWVRYMQMTDYLCVPKTTSIYRIPEKVVEQRKRQKKLDEALTNVREKHKSYHLNLNASDLAKYEEKSVWKIVLEKFKFNR